MRGASVARTKSVLNYSGQSAGAVRSPRMCDAMARVTTLACVQRSSIIVGGCFHLGINPAGMWSRNFSSSSTTLPPVLRLKDGRPPRAQIAYSRYLTNLLNLSSARLGAPRGGFFTCRRYSPTLLIIIQSITLLLEALEGVVEPVMTPDEKLVVLVEKPFRCMHTALKPGVELVTWLSRIRRSIARMKARPALAMSASIFALRPARLAVGGGSAACCCCSISIHLDTHHAKRSRLCGGTLTSWNRVSQGMFPIGGRKVLSDAVMATFYVASLPLAATDR